MVTSTESFNADEMLVTTGEPNTCPPGVASIQYDTLFTDVGPQFTCTVKVTELENPAASEPSPQVTRLNPL